MVKLNFSKKVYRKFVVIYCHERIEATNILMNV